MLTIWRFAFWSNVSAAMINTILLPWGTPWNLICAILNAGVAIWLYSFKSEAM